MSTPVPGGTAGSTATSDHAVRGAWAPTGPLPEPPWWTPRKSAACRRSLSRDLIVDTALTVLRAEGIGAISMRRVATELGTGAASLYAHVAHKEELLDIVFDTVVGEVPLPRPDPGRWREQITQVWTDVRAALVGNGDIAVVARGSVPRGPNVQRVSEVTMAILRGGGVADQAAAWAVDVIGMYVAACALKGVRHTDRQRTGRGSQPHQSQVGQYLAVLPVELLPTTAALRSHLTAGGADERFAFGLALLIDGLAASVRPNHRHSTAASNT